MSYPAILIAEKFVDLAKSQGRQLTHLQLQKLVYFAHGIHLTMTNGQPLIQEQFKAWDYGPVVHELYHALREFGNSPVSQVQTSIFGSPERRLALIDDVTKGFLGQIFQTYGGLSAGQMVHLTHKQNGAWAAVYRNSHDGIIPNSAIQNEFASVALHAS